MESNNQTKKVAFKSQVQIYSIEKIGNRKFNNARRTLPLKEATKQHTLRWKYLPDKAGPNDQNIPLRKLASQAIIREAMKRK